ncbi:hypothetical protein HMPREF3198_01593 [Winkia neuii]|nr:hypothetical protein HMPREF3198_01593 [Winkia neuii]
MATVSYFDFALVDNTRFEFQVRGEGKDFCCYFDFGRPIVLTDKTLTATLAIISGRAFDRIEVGHPLPPDCVEFLRSFCRAEIVPSASAPNLAVPYVPQKKWKYRPVIFRRFRFPGCLEAAAGPKHHFDQFRFRRQVLEGSPVLH